MEQAIIKHLKKYNYGHIKLNDQNIPIIYDLFINNIIPEPTNSEIAHHIGVYYIFKDDFENGVHYYKIGADQGYIQSVRNLIRRYKTKDDKENMMKYYLIGIEMNDIKTIYMLGEYYYDIKDYENMKKYWQICVDREYIPAIYELGCYYKANNNSINMEKYFRMAIENGHRQSFDILIKYYTDHQKYAEIIDVCMEFMDYDKKICVEKINNIIFMCFDVNIYVKAYTFLNEENLLKMNKFLASITHFNAINMDIVIEFECMNGCGKNECLMHICSHPLCCDCITQSKKCRLCQQ